MKYIFMPESLRFFLYENSAGQDYFYLLNNVPRWYFAVEAGLFCHVEKGEKEMRIYETANYEEMSRKAANNLSAQVISKPDSVLGLATGSTPIGMYDQLVEWL